MISGGCRADCSYYATRFEAACDCHRDASVSVGHRRLRVAQTPSGEDRGDVSSYCQVADVIDVGLVRRSRVSRSHAFEKSGQQKDVSANCRNVV